MTTLEKLLQEFEEIWFSKLNVDDEDQDAKEHKEAISIISKAYEAGKKEALKEK